MSKEVNFFELQIWSIKLNFKYLNFLELIFFILKLI